MSSQTRPSHQAHQVQSVAASSPTFLKINNLFSIINKNPAPEGDVTKQDLYSTIRDILAFRRDIGMKNDVYDMSVHPDLPNYLMDDCPAIDIHLDIILQYPEVAEYIERAAAAAAAKARREEEDEDSDSESESDSDDESTDDDSDESTDDDDDDVEDSAYASIAPNSEDKFVAKNGMTIMFESNEPIHNINIKVSVPFMAFSLGFMTVATVANVALSLLNIYVYIKR